LFFAVLATANVTGRTLPENQLSDEKEKIKKEFLSVWEFVNTADFTDSLTFKKYLENYADDYFAFNKDGEPPVAGKSSLMWLGNFLNTHEPKIDITIDRIEVSGDLATVFYRAHEIMKNRKTEEVIFDGYHSALSVLRRDESGKWEIVYWQWGIGK